MLSVSQSDIDETILSIAENHPEYNVEQFKTDFKSMIDRDPTLKEKQAFQRAAANVKKNVYLPNKQTNLSSLRVINGYTFLEVLGKGAFGEVYKCEKSGKSYAVKRIDETKKMSSEMEQNFAYSVSANLNSPFLVRYVDKFRSPTGELYIVMELCAKGDLRGRIEKLKDIGAALTEASLMKILIQVLIALDVLHLARFLHRDLKPENIFVDEKDDVKIGDVGCAKELDSTEAVAQTQVGTPPYESPEVVKGEEYNSSADMWSVGVLLYELIMLERPFGGMKTFQLNQAILAGKYKPIPKGRCPTEVIVIVEALLNMNAQLHPSARKLLQNPFIRAHAAVLKDASGKSLLTYLPAAAPPAEKRDLFVYVGSVARVALLLRVTPDTTFQTIREMIAKEAFMSLTVLRLVKTFKGEIISDWATVGGINTEEIYAYEDFPLTSITIANKGDEFRIVVNGQMKIEEVFDAIHKERPNLYGEYLTYQRRAADGSYRIVRIDSHGGMLVQHNVKQGEVMEPGYYFGKKIYVRTLTNGLMPFPLLCVNDTVEALKKKIFERLGIESRIQKLIYNGRELDNSWKLSDYDIQNHSFIYMITKK